MGDLMLFGVPAVGVIIVLVELAKRYGLDSRWAPLLAIGVGIGFAVVAQLASMYAWFATWAEVVMIGLVAGLVAAGLYSGQKAVRRQ